MAKKSELLTVVLFCIIILACSLAFILVPDRAFSEQENRDLAQMPEYDNEKFFDGVFGSEMNLYFSDQFPLRDWFVRLKSGAELALLKGENNGVLYSYDQLAVTDFNVYKGLNETVNTDRVFPELIKAQLGSVDRLGDNLSIPLVTVIPPRVIDIADNSFTYDRPDGDIAFELMKETLDENDNYIDTLSLLRKKYDNGEYVYYRTDHHWTTLGAYYTYCEIMKSLGKEDKIIPIDEFEIEQIEDYSGTTQSKANFPIYKKDVLEIWHLPDDDEYQVIADGKDLGGFYNRDFLETTDKYSVFLDSTHNVTEIKKEGADRETLLIAKDSFANCLIPFLAREYNIVALNLNTFTTLSSFAEYYNADAVLICYNTENLITTPHLSKVR